MNSHVLKNSLANAALLAVLAVGCGSSDPVEPGGSGAVAFTTWGEEYIETGIPADEDSGFVDGWSVRYEQFLVNFQNIQLANSSGERAGIQARSVLVDNTVAGVKSLIEFDEVPAQAWDRVSYEIAPVTRDTELTQSADEDAKASMIEGGYSVYVAGTARKGALEKSFAWGFAIGTHYSDCHSQQAGRDEAGVVVKNNTNIDVQLTTHGDHPFYDRLQSSADPSILTSLRFQAIADADANADGEVTLAELEATPLDVRVYEQSGLRAPTLGAFVTALARTIGHFRGEGECSVRALTTEPR